MAVSAAVTNGIRGLLWVAALVAGLAVIARAWSLPWISSPMNAESVFAVAVLGSIALGRRCEVAKPQPEVRSWGYAIAVAGAALVAYGPSLNAPFISDDYVHILNAAHAAPGAVAKLFTVPAADRFFRPLAMLSYLADVQWAGFSPIWWHLSNVLMHAFAAALLVVLCRELGMRVPAAVTTGALFALHAAHPEAVTWIAARFDVLATVFVLASLLFFLRFARTGSRVAEIGVYVTCMCALLSKESAYVLPLLLALILLVWPALRSITNARPVVISLLITAGVFAYRWWLLGGIGGHYQTAGGTAMIFAVDPLRTAKGLFLRSWAALFFPVNWSTGPGVALAVALMLFVAAALALAVWARPSRQAAFGAAFVLVAAVPVHQFLLIGSDLEKARVLYLPSAGFSIMVAALLDSLSSKRLRVLCTTALLTFQIAALEHNLSIWQRVAEKYAQACDVVSGTGTVDVASLPNVLDGVYFLRVGLPECVEVRHGSKLRYASGTGVYTWNEMTRQMQRAR